MKYIIAIKNSSSFVCGIDYNHEPYKHFNHTWNKNDAPLFALSKARYIVGFLRKIKEINSFNYIIMHNTGWE